MTLAQEQIDTFWRDGYLPIGKVLEDEELAPLRAAYDAEFDAAGTRGHFRNLSAPRESSDTDAGAATTVERQMLQIMQMCERSMPFRKLIHDDRLLDIVEDIIGPNIQLFHDQALNKLPRTGGPIHWHQDNAYWKCRPATLVSIWMTLDDVDVDNGAMQVIPGSHLTPVEHGSAAGGALLEIGDAINTSAAVSVDLPAGGCMLHHCQTFHHTRPNDTERPRRAFAIHCMTPGTRNASGDIMHVSFGRPMLRMRA